MDLLAGLAYQLGEARTLVPGSGGQAGCSGAQPESLRRSSPASSARLLDQAGDLAAALAPESFAGLADAAYGAAGARHGARPSGRARRCGDGAATGRSTVRRSSRPRRSGRRWIRSTNQGRSHAGQRRPGPAWSALETLRAGRAAAAGASGRRRPWRSPKRSSSMALARGTAIGLRAAGPRAAGGRPCRQRPESIGAPSARQPAAWRPSRVSAAARLRPVLSVDGHVMGRGVMRSPVPPPPT